MTETKRSTRPAAEQLLNQYFPVLDHGFIALKDYMGVDADIEEAARLSYQGGTRKASKTRGLLRHLLRSGHTGPFEQVEVKIHVSMPIFVARQWVRHRTANLNEVSGRYSMLPMLFYTPDEEDFQFQSKSNKQGRGEQAPHAFYTKAVAHWEANRAENSRLYQDLAAEGLARELARIDLPLSTYTQWHWKIDLHNLMHFLRLRCDSHAQKEIRQYANWLAGMVKRLAPLTYEAFVDYRQMSVSFSRLERELLQRLIVAFDHRGGAAGRGAAQLTFQDVQKHLGTKREADEFFAKLSDPLVRPDVDLDLRDAIGWDHFAAKAEKHTPSGDEYSKQ